MYLKKIEKDSGQAHIIKKTDYWIHYNANEQQELKFSFGLATQIYKSVFMLLSFTLLMGALTFALLLISNNNEPLAGKKIVSLLVITLFMILALTIILPASLRKIRDNLYPYQVSISRVQLTIERPSLFLKRMERSWLIEDIKVIKFVEEGLLITLKDEELALVAFSDDDLKVFFNTISHIIRNHPRYSLVG